MEALFTEVEIRSLLNKVKVFNNEIGEYQLFAINHSFDYVIKLTNGSIFVTVEELEAKFAELQGEEEGEGHEFGDEEGGEEGGFGSAEDELEDSFQTELATVREYVEKVAGGHGAEKKGAGETQVNAKSIVAGKNDMGGTTANIAKGGEGGGTEKGFVQGAKDLGVNGPKEAAKGAFKSKVTGGHGAEKAGSKESADNKQSLFRK